MNWSHKSLEPRKVYSVGNGRVLHGSVIIALLRPRRDGGLTVLMNGTKVGIAVSPADAMLMAMRVRENKEG